MFIVSYTVAWLVSVAVAALILAFLWALGRLQQEGAASVDEAAAISVQIGASTVDLGIPGLSEWGNTRSGADGPADTRNVVLLLFPGSPDAAEATLRWALPHLRTHAVPLRLRVLFGEGGTLSPELQRQFPEVVGSAGHPEVAALTPKGQPVVLVVAPDGLLCARGILHSIRTLDTLLSYPSVPWTVTAFRSSPPPRRGLERSPARAEPVRSSHVL